VPPALNSVTASSVTAPNSVLSGSIPSASGVTPPGGSSIGVPGTGGASPVTPPSGTTGSSGGIGTVTPQAGAVFGGKKCDDPQTVTQILNCIGGDAQTLADTAKLSKEEAERKMGEIEGRAREQAKIQLTADIMTKYGYSKETAAKMAENRMAVVDEYLTSIGAGSQERIKDYAGLAVGLKTNDVTLTEFMDKVNDMCGAMLGIKGSNAASCDKLGDKITYPGSIYPPTKVAGAPLSIGIPDTRKPVPTKRNILSEFLFGEVNPGGAGGGQLSAQNEMAVRGVLGDAFSRVNKAYENYRCDQKKGFDWKVDWIPLSVEIGNGSIQKNLLDKEKPFGVNLASVGTGIQVTNPWGETSYVEAGAGAGIQLGAGKFKLGAGVGISASLIGSPGYMPFPAVRLFDVNWKGLTCI
jgi:hypothetical protein